MKYYQLLLVTLVCFGLYAFDFVADYTIEKLCLQINSSEYDEISPVVSQDGNMLYFTRVGAPTFNRTLIIENEDVSKYPSENFYNEQLSWVYSQIAGEPIENPIQSSFNQDIWISSGEDGAFQEAENAPSPINDALPNSVCALIKGGSELILMNQFDPKGGMRPGFSKTNKMANGQWSFPRPIQIEGFEQNGGEVGLFVNDMETKMLISMRDPYTRGDNDLYISKKIGTNKWSKPINLGDDINTRFREVTPYLSEDERTLYFASNRRGGIGGMDIYYSVRQGQGWKTWSKPRKFYYPINTKYDDSQPLFNKATGYLYFTSKRDGSSDIFRSQIEEAEVLNFAFETVDINGKVINKGNNMPIDAEIIVRLQKEDKEFGRVKAVRGGYDLKIPKGVDIEVAAIKDGFISHSKHFSFQKDRDYQLMKNVNLFLEPIRRGNNIGHAPIYFDRSSPRFLPNSMPELRRLALILKNNPTVAVEIQGHTDNIGSSDDLVKLSAERAGAVREFLIGQGISRDRLSVKGLGSKYPIGSNASEDERKKNRRVEIKVANIEQSRP